MEKPPEAFAFEGKPVALREFLSDVLRLIAAEILAFVVHKDAGGELSLNSKKAHHQGQAD